MKKLFTLLVVFCVAISANAKKWDFTNWSPSTLSMIKAVASTEADDAAEWRTVEKSGGNGANGELGAYYKVQAQSYAPVTVGDVEIPELKGLKFSLVSAKPALAIVFDMQTTTDANKWGPYASPSYLWIQGNKDTISVPGVKRGTKLKIGVESHKLSEARGFTLAVDGTAVAADEDAAVTTKEYAEVTWTIPEGDGAEVEAKLYPNKGCHIYFIEIESDDSEKSKVCYLYTGEPTAALLDRINALDTYETYAHDMASDTPNAINFQDFDVLVIDPAFSTEKAEALKGILPWQPVVNFNANLYPAWGYGEVAEPASELALIMQKDAPLFAGIEIAEEEDMQMFTVTNGNVMPVGVFLDGNFADDVVFATDFNDSGDVTAPVTLFHGHNMNHNAYLYLPYSVEAIEDIAEGVEGIIPNALAVAAASKSKVGPTNTPVIEVVNGKLNATVTITDKISKAAIYYTLDGTDPTEESTLYTEPLFLTTDCTVKAVALGEGYLLSDIASADVKMLDQAKAPQIFIASADNEPTIVSFTTDEVAAVEGDTITIWYNYTGEADTLVSTKYVDPIKIQTTTDKTKTIYAFAIAKNLVPSELVSESLNANTGSLLRRKVLTHMDSNSTDWNGGSTSTKYYFSWGKSAQSAYIEDVDPESGDIIQTLRTPETFQPGTDDGSGVKTFENEMNADWQIKSYGQVIDWVSNSIGSTLNDGGGYNPCTVNDLDTEGLITKFFLQFGGKASGESANASIETVKKFKGPFNVLAFLGNGQKSDGAPHTIEIAVSTDTTAVENWVALDSVKTPDRMRNWSKYEIPYNGTDEVFVRAKQVLGGANAYCFDIYLMGPGGNAEVLKGDADEDGEVTVSDITTIAAYILGNNPSPFNFDNADVDGDTAITVSDITGTASIILGN